MAGTEEQQAKSSKFLMLSKLIRENKNVEFVSIVSKDEITNLIDSEVAELLHTAIFYENVTAIEHLITSGCDVNCQNSRGQNSLALTLQHKKYLAAECLLSQNKVEILKVDKEGHSALQICYQNEINPPSHIILTLLEKMKNCNLTAEQRACEIAKSGCPINHVLTINDGEALGPLLDRLSISDLDAQDLMDRAVNLGHASNVRALMTRGSGLDKRFEVFVDKLKSDPSKTNLMPVFRQLIDWQVFDRDILLQAAWQSVTDDSVTVQTLLDNNLDNYVKQNYGLEVLARLFSNPFEGAFELVKNRSQFWVNGIDPSELSGLHWAALSGNVPGITYLINRGANPNIRGANNRTPLFYAKNEETLEILLNAGADLQAIDDDGKTTVSNLKGYSEYVAVHISVLEAKKMTKQALCNVINVHPYCRVYLDTIARCRKELLRLKSYVIKQAGVSLYRLLVDDLEQVADYIRNKENAVEILMASRATNYFSIKSMQNMLEANLRRAGEMYELRLKASEFFCGMFGDVHSSHLVIQHIVRYLKFNDLLEIIRVQLSNDQAHIELSVL